MSARPVAPAEPRLRVLEAILWGGLAVGVLDILDAFIVWGLRGVSPVRILQSIAAGLLGRASFQGGPPTALLGLVLHFFIATSAATAYVLASLKLPVLIRKAVPCGMAYGVAFYFFMNYVVIPLSAINRTSGFSWPLFLNGIIGHALLVGLPIALFTRRAARPLD